MGCFLVMTERDYQMMDLMNVTSRSESPAFAKVSFISRTTDGALVRIDGQSKTETTRLANAVKTFFPATRAVGSERWYQPQSHHIFPEKHRGLFERVGIDIDRWTVQLDARHHRRMHPGSEGWTNAWDQFVNHCPGREPDEIRQGAIRFAGQLLTSFGMSGLDIRPHQTHPT